MPFEPGTKLGPYEILAALPGSGEAYKASDTKRNRTVKLRVLLADTLDNPALTQRLEREAQILSSLNHPNISAVYEVERHQDATYLVADYVEGETLAECLTRGPLEMESALKVAIAIADALDKAHRKNVVHRGLSPSSVVLTAEGVRLVDFGLTDSAQMAGPVALGSMAATGTAPLTATATPAPSMPYQSPEQIEGKEPDARSDIFAFGTILYEMVAGKPAFEGKTQALLIAAISSIDPEPLSKVQPMTPPALEYVVRRCLVKTPQKRLQTAWDLLCQLRWIAGGEEGLAALAAPQKKRERLLRIALAAASLLALGLAPTAYFYYRGSPGPPDARFVVSDLGFMFASGGSTPSLSPNGRWMSSGRSTDDPGLDVIALDSVTKQTLVKGTSTYLGSWKPDSEEIVFFNDGKIKKIKVSGGAAQNICDAPPLWGGVSWGSTGVILFSSEGIIYRVLDVGGDRVPVTKLDASREETEHIAPFFLPDGRHFLYFAVSSKPANSAIYVASLDSADRTLLFESESKAVYATPGYVLFNRGDVVYARAFDADKLTVKGEPIRIADGVPVSGAPTNGTRTPLATGLQSSGTFTVSQTGMLAYRSSGAVRRGNATSPTLSGAPLSLVWFDRSNRGTPIGPPGTYAGVNLSPDGKRFAVHRHEGEGGDIWLYDPDQGDRMQRFTFDVSQENSMPVWSPDGKRIAFASRRNGKWGIYMKSADNTGNEELIVETNVPTAPMSWTTANQLVYWIEDPKTRGDVWAVPMTGEHKPAPILNTDADERFPQVSADGKWIAYQAQDAMGAMQIWVNSFPKGQGSGWQVTNDGGIWPRWRGDGKELELYFYQAPTVLAVTLGIVGSAIQPRVPRLLFGAGNPNLIGSSHYSVAGSYYRYAVSPDGQRFLLTQPAADAPASNRGGPPRGARGMLADVIASSIDQARGAPTVGAQAMPNEIAIVLNWPRLLKEK